MLNGRAISWRSKGQPIVAMSTAEAELIAASRAAQEAMYLRILLRDLGCEQINPTLIFEDNQACIAMSKEGANAERGRHIDRRDNQVRDLSGKGHVKLEYLNTDDMTADVLTKSLPKESHEKHVSFAMGEKPRSILKPSRQLTPAFSHGGVLASKEKESKSSRARNIQAG